MLSVFDPRLRFQPIVVLKGLNKNGIILPHTMVLDPYMGPSSKRSLSSEMRMACSSAIDRLPKAPWDKHISDFAVKGGDSRCKQPEPYNVSFLAASTCVPLQNPTHYQRPSISRHVQGCVICFLKGAHLNDEANALDIFGLT